MKPYLPLEWTPKGMLERVNAFTEYYVSTVRAIFARDETNVTWVFRRQAVDESLQFKLLGSGLFTLDCKK